MTSIPSTSFGADKPRIRCCRYTPLRQVYVNPEGEVLHVPSAAFSCSDLMNRVSILEAKLKIVLEMIDVLDDDRIPSSD